MVTKPLDIWEQYGLDPHRHSSGGLHYADLATMRQHWREDQKKDQPGSPEQDLRYTLAVEGKLPDL